MALGVRVLDAETNGAVSLRQSIIRSLPDALLGITGAAMNLVFFGATENDPTLKTIVPIYIAIRTGWFFADFFMMLNNAERRSLHDLLAGTVVVREEKPLY